MPYGHLKYVLGKAICDFTDATGVHLPWNLNKVSEWKGIQGINEETDQHPYKEVQKIVHSCKQLAGWLLAARKFPAVTRLISRTQSPNGMGSPYTTINLWDFVEKNPSPGRLERQIWKVKRQAKQILSAWEGDHNPSWASIANALCHTNSVRKAAVIVAAETLDAGTYKYGEYRGHGKYSASRDFLVSIRSARFPVADNSDGVNARREDEPTLNKFGYQVYRIRLTDQYGRYHLQWLVTMNGRTYHSNQDDAREALKQAIWAWKKQKKLQARNAKLIGFLNGDQGYSPFVYLQDSYDAGNCSAGTTSWLQKRGWSDRKFIPGRWLVPHLSDDLVRNVAMKVYRDRYGDEQQAA